MRSTKRYTDLLATKRIDFRHHTFMMKTRLGGVGLFVKRFFALGADHQRQVCHPFSLRASNGTVPADSGHLLETVEVTFGLLKHVAICAQDSK